MTFQGIFLPAKGPPREFTATNLFHFLNAKVLDHIELNICPVDGYYLALYYNLKAFKSVENRNHLASFLTRRWLWGDAVIIDTRWRRLNTGDLEFWVQHQYTKLKQ